MTQVLPFRAFKCPPTKDAFAVDSRRLDASLVTTSGAETGRPTLDGAILDGAIPVFGESSAGGFLVLRHDYTAPSGIRKSRFSLLALLKPASAGGGTIKAAQDVEPREVTSLLAELQRAGTQSEPVIVAYDDARLELDRMLEKACLDGEEPELEEQGSDGDQLRVWKIASEPVIDEIIRFFQDREVYVLDGLHVYRAFRKLNEERARPDGGESAGGCPLTVLANLCDFGVHLTAHHLLVRDLPPVDINELVLRLSPYFDVKSFRFAGDRERSEVIRRFREEFRVLAYTDNAIGAYFRGNAQLFLFRLREGVDHHHLFLPDVRREHHRLDAFLLRHVILDRYVLADPGAAMTEGVFEYALTIEEAVHGVTSGRCGAAFFLNPPTKRELTELLRDGLRLPPGSVAIDPPVPSGLIAHLL